MACLDMVQHFGNGLKLGQILIIQLLLSHRHLVCRHLESTLLIERSDNSGNRHTAPRIKELLAELAVPFRKGPAPRDVMKRHRVGDSAVAVEQVSLKRSRR